MPSIACDVYNCSHNTDGGCKLSFLRVEGDEADYPDETICQSYTDSTSPNVKSDIGEDEYPKEYADVDCSAENCKYNSDHVCTADRISVGDSSAYKTRDTACETFDSEDTI